MISRMLVAVVWLGLSASWTRAEEPRDFGLKPETSAREIQAPVRLELTAGRDIIAELDQMGLYQPTRAFYAGHMGKIYDAAMAVVSRKQQYMTLGDDERYLDPTTEAHESLHAMSSLIRGARGWSISQGYDMIYVGNGQFATVRVGPGITKGHVGTWLPRHMKDSEIVKIHMSDPAFKESNVALILEELAYHLLDGKIGLENHAYMEHKLGITTAVTVPAVEWSVVALATATMLDGDPKGFPKVGRPGRIQPACQAARRGVGHCVRTGDELRKIRLAGQPESGTPGTLHVPSDGGLAASKRHPRLRCPIVRKRLAARTGQPG